VDAPHPVNRFRPTWSRTQNLYHNNQTDIWLMELLSGSLPTVNTLR